MSNKAAYDDVNTNMLAYVGIASAIITFVLYAGLQATYYAYFNYDIAQKNTTKITVSTQAIIDQKEQLNQYGWVNKEEKVVAIPIGKAKELVLEQYSKK